MYLPGVASNFASTPDAAALDITGDIDLRVQVALDDWTPATTSTLISKWNSTTNQRSYAVDVSTTGFIVLNTSSNGTSITSTATSSVATGLADGSVKWVRITRVASTALTRFFLSDDGITWTQLGTDISGTPENIFSGSSDVAIGSTLTSGGANPSAGKFYRAQILDGIAGTTVLDIDFASARVGLSSTFTAVSGQTVTLEPSTSSTKAVISYFAGNAHRSISYYPQYGGTYQIATLRPTAVITNPQVALAYYAQWVATEAVVTALDVIIDDGDTTFNPTPLELQHLYPAHQTYDLLASAYTNYADLADETTVKITVADVSAVETNVEAQETLALADLATGQTIDGQFIQPLMLVGN
jgi:hypothetical protein